MDVTTAGGRWWRRAGLAAMAAFALAIASRPARAGDDEQRGKPWFPMVEDGASAETVYARYALSVVHEGDAGWRVNRGAYREGVSRKDFFVTVGRADLAASERRRAGLKSGFLWTGAGLAVGGGLLMYAAVSRGGFDPPPTWALGTMAAGGICVVISSMIHGPEVTVDEVDAVVGRYNQLLKLHIEEEMGIVRPKPIQARLEMIAPYVDGQSGAGVLAIARF